MTEARPSGGVTGLAPPSLPPPRDGSSARSEAYHSYVHDIHARLNSPSMTFVGSRLAQLTLGRVGVEPMGPTGAALSALLCGSIRLLIVFAITAAAGDWGDAPVWRWMLVIAVLGGFDAVFALGHAPAGRATQDSSGLIPTILRESDLRELADFTRRWCRLRVSAPVALAMAALLLLTLGLVSPASVDALPAGSLALLAILFYEVGEIAFWSLFSWPFWRRQAAFDHQLFWVSPVDSMAVQRALRVWATAETGAGVAVTGYLVLAVVVVSLDSPLVLPIAAGLTVTGYLTTLLSTLAVRNGVRTIVQRIRDENLALVQSRIDAFGPRFADLSPEDNEQVRHLIALHDTIRDAPVSPRWMQTLSHAFTALIIPTMAFLLAVLSEVYAERVMDRLLP